MLSLAKIDLLEDRCKFARLNFFYSLYFAQFVVKPEGYDVKKKKDSIRALLCKAFLYVHTVVGTLSLEQ